MMDKDTIWQQIQTQLDQLEGSDEERKKRNSIFQDLTPELLTDEEFILSTDKSVIHGYVSRNYIGSITDSISSLTGKDYRVEIHLQLPDSNQPVVSKSTDSLYSIPSQSSRPQQTQRDYQGRTQDRAQDYHPSYPPADNPYIQTQSQQSIDTPSYDAPSYDAPTYSPESTKTFENFVVAEENNLAYSMSRSVAENPGNQYNPLFIYGKSGLGKTHLLLAIRNFIHFHQPHLRVQYAQTIDFVNDFTNSIRYSQWDDFSDRYRNCDVLLLDDVQRLENKERSTDEIFTIFNDMISRGKQIVLSADRPPKNIDLDERYISRFSQGILADINPPTFETKLAILKNCVSSKCNEFRIESFFIPEDVYTRIVEMSSSNIRNLEGAATTLVAYLSVRDSNMPITLQEVEGVVENVFLHSSKKNITISMIQREVENYYHISHQDMIGTKRSHNISQPRQIAMYLARTLTDDISYPEIGRSFGGKNHTTVMYSVNNIEKKRLEDPQIRKDIENLIGILEG